MQKSWPASDLECSIARPFSQSALQIPILFYSNFVRYPKGLHNKWANYS